MIFGGALQKAIDADDEAAVQAAIEGGDPVSSDALSHAAVQQKHVALRALLARVDEVPATPMVLAAQNGRAKSLQLLLDGGANVDIEDRSGLTALFHSALSNSVDCVDLLVKAGANLEHEDGQGRVALDIAIKHEGADAARALIGHGAKVSEAQAPALAKLGLDVAAAPAPADESKRSELIGHWRPVEVRYEGDLETAGFDPESDTRTAEGLSIGDDVLVVLEDESARWTYFGATSEGRWTCDGDRLVVTNSLGDAITYTLSKGRLIRADHDEEHGLDMFVEYTRD